MLFELEVEAANWKLSEELFILIGVEYYKEQLEFAPEDSKKQIPLVLTLLSSRLELESHLLDWSSFSEKSYFFAFSTKISFNFCNLLN